MLTLKDILYCITMIINKIIITCTLILLMIENNWGSSVLKIKIVLKMTFEILKTLSKKLKEV